MAETPEQEEARYTVGSWSGKPNYTCTRCPYATVADSEEEGAALIDAHWNDVHRAPAVWPAPEEPTPQEGGA